ncbi:MAG: hydrogenase formation protein HypD [Peptococcaceae bacterium]|nr:hydrogenase formation protein HypD [Peptococcaceae bacterium]
MRDKMRDPALCKQLMERITPLAYELATRFGRPMRIMEVCGTHTMAIARTGLKHLLSESLELRSGPGCPVCVTDRRDIDHSIALAATGQNLVVATFGDMLRVPGSESSLEKERAKGAKVEIFYSPMDAVNYASEHPQNEVVFIGVGFETTTPAIALSVAGAKERGLANYSVLSIHKTVPQVLRQLLDDRDLNLDGLLLPGHVCTVTGYQALSFVSAEYRMPSVVAGFEPAELLGGIYLLLKQIKDGRAETLNGYPDLVRENGNVKAQALVREYFYPVDAAWRGFGTIPQSGLALRPSYAGYDAAVRFPVDVPETDIIEDCACGDVLKGKVTPKECLLFATACTPVSPVGPCMVSSEGACAAHYIYQL